MQNYYFGWFQYWTLYHKVTFDGLNKLIIINDGETEIDVQRDIYSSWKEWLIEYDYSKWLQAIRSVGGDPIVEGVLNLGATFFLVNGWRIRPWEGDYSITIDGNIYTDEGDSPFVPTVNPSNILLTNRVSNLIDRITELDEVLTTEQSTQLMSLPSSSEVALEVWDTTISGHLTEGTTGKALYDVSTASGITIVELDEQEKIDIADRVWDETLSGHQLSGSTGEALLAASTASGIEIDVQSVVDGVWDEATSSHLVVGSFGELMSDMETSVIRSLGLMQENYYLDQTSYTTYQGAPLLTSGRLRIYSDAGSVGTSSNVVATYQITSTWSGNELQTYKVVKS